MDWLSKKGIKATATADRYIWHHQPTAEVGEEGAIRWVTDSSIDVFVGAVIISSSQL